MRKSTLQAARAAAFGLLLVSAGSALAQAPPPAGQPDKREWQFELAPNLWAASLNGHVGVSERLPPAKVDQSFSDILDHLEFGFMLAGEARKDKFGIVFDITYIALSDDNATPGPLFGNAKLTNDTLFGDFYLLYRVLSEDRVWLDAGAGARAWYMHNKLELSPGLLQGGSRSDSQAWADPLIALRGNVGLGSGFSLRAEGDIGGFSAASRLTWQAVGLVGYQFNDRIAGAVGYRYLSVDYKNDGFVWDVHLAGPIIGVRILF